MEDVKPVHFTLYYTSHDSVSPGDNISIADLLGVCELMQVSICGVDIYPGHPRLRAWMDRTKARLQPTFDEVHQVMYDVREKFLTRQMSRQGSKANM